MNRPEFFGVQFRLERPISANSFRVEFFLPHPWTTLDQTEGADWPIVELLVAMGYGGSHRNAAAQLGRTGDGGVDGVINEDVLGLDRVYVQARASARQVDTGWRKKRMRKQEDRAPDLIQSDRFAL